MKIRNGFVSNSSASSFIIIIPKFDFDKAMETASENIKIIMAHCNKAIENFLGTDVVVLYEVFNMDESEIDMFSDLELPNIEYDEEYKDAELFPAEIFWKFIDTFENKIVRATDNI